MPKLPTLEVKDSYSALRGGSKAGRGAAYAGGGALLAAFIVQVLRSHEVQWWDPGMDVPAIALLTVFFTGISKFLCNLMLCGVKISEGEQK